MRADTHPHTHSPHCPSFWHTYTHSEKSPILPSTHTLTNADTVIDWYGTVNKEFLSVFELCLALDNSGWVSGRKDSVGVWEGKTENKGKRESSMATRKHSGGEERTVWTLTTPAGLHCAAQEQQWLDKAIKYEHTSSKWSDWPQPKWNQTTSVVWTKHLEFLDGGWMSPPACLGKELTVTLSVKEGARKVEREAGRQGVKDSMRKRGWERKNEDRCCHCD